MAAIVQSPDVLGGEPRIEGTRIGVLTVVELVLDGRYPPADVADQLDRPLEEIYTALAYYHEHREEMRSLEAERTNTAATLAERSLQPPEPASRSE